MSQLSLLPRASHPAPVDNLLSSNNLGETAIEVYSNIAIEKFDATDLSGLRQDLAQSGLDLWQAAEFITAFLSGRGYGVCNQAARCAASRMESLGCSLQSMQEELEKLALVM